MNANGSLWGVWRGRRAIRLFAALAFCLSPAWATDFYVVPGGAGTRDGTSWTNALGDVQAAINACAASGSGTVKIAGGTYKPTSQPNLVPSGSPAPSPAPPAIYNHFSLRNNVKVWGGYKQSPETRDPQLYPTVLSGDIGGDLKDRDQDSDGDGLLDANLGDNCRVFYHPPWVSTNPSAQLDGVIISGGYGRNNSYSPGGGGLNGGGMFNAAGSSPMISNCVFRDNSSEGNGGAIQKEGAYSSSTVPVLDRCTFIANKAMKGGAVGFSAGRNLRVENCTFVANSATTEGGAVYTNGTTGGSPTAIRNCTFVNNRAGSLGGGVFDFATVTNCILWGNGDNSPSNPQLTADTVSYSIVQGGFAGTKNLNKDPLLLPLNNYGGKTPTMALRGDSPAINSESPDAPGFDQRGYPRNPGYDIGAYEYQPGLKIYVKPGGTGNGTSWADACGDLAAVISEASTTSSQTTEIWVAEGTYTGTIFLRTNVSVYGGFSGNETALDQRDIASHPTILSADLNGDDADTDGDGIPDSGTSENAADVCSSHAEFPSAMLDGFILSGAKTAAIRNFNGPPDILNAPTITNCTFRYNMGASVLNDSHTAAAILNCTFHHNGTTNPVMMNAVNSSPAVVNCTFSNSSSTDSMPVIVNQTQSISPRIVNCTFAVGAYQTAISNASSSQPIIRNCIIWGNSNTAGIQGGSPIVSNCVIQGGFSGGKNVSTQNALLMPLRNYGGAMLTRPVSAGSAAISQGLAGGMDAPYADQRGFTRDAKPDIGACEWQANLLVIQTPEGETRYPQGSRAELEVVSEAFDLTGAGWQWFVGQVGDTSNPINGATSNRYVTPPLNETAHYWVLRTPDGLSAAISLDVFAPSVVFVKPGGNDGADGSSWAQAKQSVEAALQTALPGQDIWVAAGTYRISGNPLALRNNVRLMGGFAGSESSLTEGNIAANPAVLSADYSGNDADSNGDGIPDSNLSDNRTSIFENSGVGKTAVLDAFVLSGASQQAILNINSSPTISNCVFTKNSGSMIENQSSSPTVDSCAFYQNGGGIRNSYGYPTFKNCSFWDNSFNQFGYPQNALVTDDWNSASSIINCTILSEPGQPSIVSDSGNVAVSNCILWGNGDSAPAIWWSGADVSNCVIQGGHSGGANVITDAPLLLPPGYYAGPTPCMPVSAGSPAINAGVVTANTPTFDQRGFMRDVLPDIGSCEWQENLVVIQSGNDANRYAIGSTASLSVASESALPGTNWQWYRGAVGDTSDPIAGATQSRYVTAPLTADAPYWVRGWTIQFGPIDAGITLSVYAPHIIYVSRQGYGDGSSWQNAMPSIHNALASAQTGDQIWVAEGFYTSYGPSLITLRSGVSVYGGFSGKEKRFDERDVAAHPTILSADTFGNDVDSNGDGVPDSGTSENVSYVCSNSGVGSSAVLDGFILSGAKSAAIMNTDSSPTVINCTFRSNLGTSIQNDGYCMPEVLNCSFHNNATGTPLISHLGAGSISIVNCTFIADNYIGPFSGPLISIQWQGSSMIRNCTFLVRSAQTAIDSSGFSSIQNCIIWGNTSFSAIAGGAFAVSDCVIQGYFSGGTNIIHEDPKLLPLGNYGGATPTMPVNAGSSAIDSGVAGPDIPYADQRGFIRGAQPDIGACEWQQHDNVAIQTEEGTDSYAIGSKANLFVNIDVPVSSWQWYVGATGDTSNPIDGATFSRYGTPALTAETSYWVRGSFSGGIFDASISLKVFSPRVIRVSEAGNDTLDGSSWQTSKQSLKGAMNAAQTGDHIWVAAGTYPGTFALRGGVSVYGGFSEVETRLDQRDIAAHPTILTADLNGDDVDSDGDGIPDSGISNNAPYVCSNRNIGASGILDGFIFSGAATAAILNTGSSPTIANCMFRYNTGVCIGNSNNSSPVIGGCTFYFNSLGRGVANSVNCSPVISNCTFSSPLSATAPIITGSVASSPKIANCTFKAGTGQAAILSEGSDCLPTIRNCIVWGNSSAAGIVGGFPAVKNCIIRGGFSGGTSITNSDPQFLPLAKYGGPTLTMPLLSNSMAINHGVSGSDIPYSDQRGFPRDAQPDIGACEFGMGTIALVGIRPSGGIGEEPLIGDEPVPPNMIGSTVGILAYTERTNVTCQWFYGLRGDMSKPVSGTPFYIPPSISLQGVAFGPLEAGVTVWARVTPGDGSAAIDTNERTFEVQGTYDQWCDYHGLNGADRATDATVAGDGIGNLLKFALGLRPRDRGSIGDCLATRFDSLTSKLTQEWRISKTPSGLTIILEGSNDLKTWSPVAPVMTSEDAGFETWKASLDASPPAKAAYLRARIIKQ